MDNQTPLEQNNYQTTPPVAQKSDRKYLRWSLLTVLVLMLIAGTAYGVYQYEKSQSNDRETKLNSEIATLKSQVNKLNERVNDTKEDESAVETSDLPASVVDIPDLGLKVTVPGELADLTSEVIHLAGDQAVNSVVLSSKKAELAGCARSSGPLGYLTYDNDKGGTVVATARGSNVYHLMPTNTCKAVTASTMSMLKEALKSLVSDNTQ